MLRISFKYTDEHAKRFYNFGGNQMVPTRPEDAAIDLRAMKNVVVMPGECIRVPSGIAIDIAPRDNVAALVLPRSGLGTRGLILGNTLGLIDAGYQGDITLTLWNRSADPITVEAGDRVAQLLIIPVAFPLFVEVSDFVPSDRGEAGFGSSGVR